MEELFNRPYFVIPTCILDVITSDKNLNGTEKFLFLIIYFLCEKEKTCVVTNKKLSKLIHRSKNTTSESLKTLIDNGYVYSDFNYTEGKKGFGIESRILGVCYDKFEKRF